MSNNLAELFREHGKQVVAKHLRAVVGQPPAALVDGTYERLVVGPAWKEMPLPCKLLGRRRLQWDEFFERLAAVAYDQSGPLLKFAPDATVQTTAAFKEAVARIDALFETTERTVESVADSSEGPADTGRPVDETAPDGETADEPDTPPVAVGIDLGTTYSAISFVDEQGRPCSIENTGGENLTPSVVFFDDDGHVVGREARMAGVMDPDRVADCAKRDMGRPHYRKLVAGESIPPEVVSSIVLRTLKADAERKLGPVTKVVITVPAYFDEPRRRATMDAGRLAGLEVLDIVNEPTAAAVCYGYESGFVRTAASGAGDQQRRRVLVYDLGGGTFDVTLLEIQGNSFRTLATDGDVRLGGKDWDERLVELVAERFAEEHGDDPREDPASLQELWESVEAAKKSLTELKKAQVYVNHLGKRGRVEVTRDEFEDVTAPLLDRTQHTTELVVRQAGASWDEIDRVLLVGGSTRMPMVTAMLEELTGRPVDRSLSPDVSVAHGAALYAQLLLSRSSGVEPSFELTNVNSHSLGIVGLDKETGRKVNHVLIPKNTALPCTVDKVCRTAKENQRSVKLEVLEGESPRPDQCTLVGVSSVRDLPETLPAGTRVHVRYEYEANGRLQVSAKIDGHDERVSAVFAREGDIDAGEMQIWSEYVAHQANRDRE